MNIVGKHLTKNTVVGVSLGTLVSIVVAAWAMSGIGRPLFAADLARIETKIDSYQDNTAVQILSIRKESLQSELREAKRDARRNPDDDDAADDVDEITADIKTIDDKIACYRAAQCKVESDL